MKSQLDIDGYVIYRNVIDQGRIEALRKEADRLSEVNNSACVRRISERSPLIHALARSEVLLNLLPPDMFLVRSILFDKTPRDNWPIRWHQDLMIAVAEKIEIDGYAPWSIKDDVPHVRPPMALLQQMATIRLHLDDTPSANGALRVAPGSHLAGAIADAEAKQTAHGQCITCECAAGDALVMRPLILHASSRSKSPTRRRVIHLEFAPHNALHPMLQWHEN